MSWKTEVIQMVRYLIGDTDTSAPDYCDDRIVKASVISAHQLINEVEFDRTYTINVVASSITPDPTEVSPKDESFLYLLSLKTSILIVGGELRSKAQSSISLTDGPSKIDFANVYKNYKDLVNDLNVKYEQAKNTYKLEKIVHAVLTPYTVENIPPYSPI